MKKPVECMYVCMYARRLDRVAYWNNIVLQSCAESPLSSSHRLHAVNESWTNRSVDRRRDWEGPESCAHEFWKREGVTSFEVNINILFRFEKSPAENRNVCPVYPSHAMCYQRAHDEYLFYDLTFFARYGSNFEVTPLDCYRYW